MSKSIVLVLEPNHESEYGEYANTPAFNAHGDIIGWTGGEVSESGHSCEFNVLNDEGFITCASSTTVNKIRGENAKLRELVDILCFCMQIRKRCDDCKLNGAKGELGLGHDPLLACDGLHEMLKDLGIEVEP